MRTRGMLIADIIAALLFAVSAAIQLNDPDPGVWIAIYLGGAVVAGIGWRWLPGLVAAIAVGLVSLIWSVVIFTGIDTWVGFGDLVGPMEIDGGPVELTREALGLLIIAGYAAYVALRWRRLPSAAS